MPDTPASVITYFAASNAVRDFAAAPVMSSQEREKWLDPKVVRYGFGPFIGTEGKVHVGIEKHPFLAPLTREGSGLSSQSGRMSCAGEERSNVRSGWIGLRWRSGRIREGGWI